MARGTTTTGAGLAALALLGASACSAASGDDGGTVLRIGELGAVPAAPALLEAAGVDQDLPYEIEWKQFANAGPEYVEAAGVDEVDLGVTADTPLIFADAADAGLKAVAVVSIDAPEEQSDNAILVPAGSDASSVADLKGARVAFQEGTITQYHVIKALESEGLGLDDIEPVNLPVTDGATALQNGEVDALATLQTHWAQAEADGARALVTGSGLIAGNSLVSARAEAIDDPDLGPAIEDYLGRLAEAVQWKEEHPREWAEIYAGLSGLPEEVVLASEERAASSVGPVTDEAVAAQQDQSDVYLEVGVLDERQDAAGQFDPSYNGVFGAPTELGGD